jgi:GntR family transcriptional regulator
LRGLSESLTGEGRAIHTRLLSHKTVKASEHVAGLMQIPVKSAISELRTVRYLNRVPLSVNHSYMSIELGERLKKTDLANRDILGIYENDLGLTIGHADLSISALTAENNHCKHLAVEPGTALLQVERVLFDANRRPIQLELSSYRSDMFSYSLSVERRRM